MESDAEKTLRNLHVLGALSHNDKLITNSTTGLFDIYSPTALRGAFRMWYGETRMHNVQCVRTTVRAGMQLAVQYLDEANALLSDRGRLRLRVHTLAQQHSRMCDAVARARDGMAHLTQTYREDAAFVAQVRLVEEEIGDFLAVTRPHTEELKLRMAPHSSPTPLPSPRSASPATSTRDDASD